MAFGLCLSDFKPTPDICPILGCPLIEGKEYVVNILKKIPPLPFVSIYYVINILIMFSIDYKAVYDN